MMLVEVLWYSICMIIFYCGMFSDSVVLCICEGISCSILLVVCIIIGSMMKVSDRVLVNVEKLLLVCIMYSVQMNRFSMMDGVDSRMLLMKWIMVLILWVLLYLVSQVLVSMFSGVLMLMVSVYIIVLLKKVLVRLLFCIGGGVILVNRFRLILVRFLEVRVNRIQFRKNRLNRVVVQEVVIVMMLLMWWCRYSELVVVDISCFFCGIGVLVLGG